MNDILLAGLILFSGFVPVTIALWYSRELLKTAKGLYNLGKEERQQTVIEVEKWLLDKQFSDHIQNVIRGAYGRDVRKVKDSLHDEAILQGLPPPAKKTIAKGIAGFCEDYGVGKKTAKGIEAAMEMLLNRKSKAEKERDKALVEQYARDLGYDPTSVSGPQIPIIK